MQAQASLPTERVFTEQMLRRYNGDDDAHCYIAHQGIVYDVTDCPHWRNGLHEGLHFPGQDLSAELPDAPHSDEVFSRPCVKRIGRLQKA